MPAKNRRERGSFAEAVAAQLAAERSAHRLTQSDLAEAAGIPRISYVRLEKGERVADVQQLHRILGVYGLSLSAFMARAEQRMVESMDITPAEREALEAAMGRARGKKKPHQSHGEQSSQTG